MKKKEIQKKNTSKIAVTCCDSVEIISISSARSLFCSMTYVGGMVGKRGIIEVEGIFCLCFWFWFNLAFAVINFFDSDAPFVWESKNLLRKL